MTAEPESSVPSTRRYLDEAVETNGIEYRLPEPAARENKQTSDSSEVDI